MSEDAIKLAQLEARAAEQRTQSLERELARRDAEKIEAQARAQGRRVTGVPGWEFTGGVGNLAREKAERIERGEEETAASRIERFREQHADVGRAAQLLEREARKDETE